MAKRNKAEELKDTIEETPVQEVEKETTTEGAEEQAVEEEKLSEEEQLRIDLKEEKDKFLRLFAEFENYKKRTTKERIDLFKTAGQEVIQSLLPVSYTHLTLPTKA